MPEVLPDPVALVAIPQTVDHRTADYATVIVTILIHLKEFLEILQRHILESVFMYHT